MSKYDFIVFIGRFQPFHAGHFDVVKQAFQKTDHLIMIIGSHEKSPDIRNPLNSMQRESIIDTALGELPTGKVITKIFQQDHTYNETRWISEIQESVYRVIHRGGWTDKPKKYRIGLIGYDKDHTTFYLNKFPQWETISVIPEHDINATMIRNSHWEYQESDDSWFVNSTHKDAIKSALYNTNLFEEYQYIRDYKKSWEASPYPVNFVTGDALITQAGHILVVERGGMPGIGQIAMPGGFINPKEKLLECVVRELREETKLKVPEPVLYGSIKKSEIFDSPDRSTRGRIITYATHFELRDIGALPRVMGSDDARRAYWMPVSEFLAKRSLTFEDHHCIVTKMLGL